MGPLIVAAVGDDDDGEGHEVIVSDTAGKSRLRRVEEKLLRLEWYNVKTVSQKNSGFVRIILATHS